ncbi:MAG: uroporphyrinogen decarboxylase family protein [Clostridia bacterium]|nr:uroporphyrinogen decarboxylase family protein [Clostridia bacterium]
MNMRSWADALRNAKIKKAMPILSFPSVQLMGISVRELIASADMQAKGMKMIADRIDSAASVSMMDLSVEAEAFGAAVRFSDDEVPTVIDTLITDEEEADTLTVPTVGVGRTGLYIEAIRKACELITDRPVFAGVIGPYSLAGRLLDVSEIMILCYEEPDMVHTVLRKATDFLIAYMNAYKSTGAAGVVVAEPLAGLLSPSLMEEFASPYMKEIVDAVQTDDFAVIYHNCGNAVEMLADEIVSCGAMAYHFGNAVNMKTMLEKMPSDILVMGNIDPIGELKNGTPDSVYAKTTELLRECAEYDNFIISSGCDVPPMAKWENIDAFFCAVKDFYK